MTVELQHPGYGSTRQVAPAISLSVSPASVRTPPPLLGEHTDEILTDLGFEAAEIARLRETSVI